MSAFVGRLRGVKRSKADPLCSLRVLALAIFGLLLPQMAEADVPAGGPAAHEDGVFGPAVTWPLIAIHSVLLSDGRVMTYGTDERGRQTGEIVYDLWDPEDGTDLSAHRVLPNTLATDIFCGGQASIEGTGELLISGGSRTIDGSRNHSNDEMTIFDPKTETLRAAGVMEYPRWYPAVVATAVGDMVIIGGRLGKEKTCDEDGRCKVAAAHIPEVYNVNTGWRTLNGAGSEEVFNRNVNWWYPPSYLNPNGDVDIIAFDGGIYRLNTDGEGTLTEMPVELSRPTRRFRQRCMRPARCFLSEPTRNCSISI